MFFWIWFAKIFWGVLHLYSWERLACRSLFFVVSWQAVLRKKNKAGGIISPDFKLYYKSIIINTVWYWHKKKTDTQISGAEWRTQKWAHGNLFSWFLTRQPRIDNGEKTVPSISGFRKTEYPHGKEWKWTSYLLLYTKINSSWIKSLNISPETIKLLEENIKSKLLDIGLDNTFLNLGTRTKISGITSN